MALAIAGSGLAAPVAFADHHLIKIREVFPGSTSAGPATDYVELQMYASGQNQFMTNGVAVKLYDDSGNELVDQSLTDHNPANASSQRTVLVGTAGVANPPLDVAPDYALPSGDNVDPAGGAACFTSTFGGIDCVSWGSFDNTSGTPLPSPTGSPAAPSGIADGSALTRRIDRACAGLLEAVDDSNDSSVDFQVQNPTPRSNAIQPTEGPCPETTITKGPSGRTHDRTPTFRFHSSEPGSTFRCKVDSHAYKDCDSPFTTKRLDFGRHKFRVFAIDPDANPDPIPAKRSFRVVRRS